jgi:protein SCO1/2
MFKNNRWVLIVGLLVGLGIVAAIALPRLKPYAFYGTVLQSPDKAPNFELESVNGTVSLDDFQGQIVLLYFGYTFCPDVCPATLAEVAKAMDILGKKAKDVQLIMVSVDPGRDTPEMLRDYVTHFHPSFLGVTGSEDDIAALATLYGIFYEKHEGTEATGYLVDHTATVMVVDQEGYLKLIFPFGAPAEEIAEDLAFMLK